MATNLKYHAIPQTVFFSGPNRAGGRTPRISWKVVDVTAGINERAYPMKTLANCNDEAIARQIADMLNGVNGHAEYWQTKADRAGKEIDALRKQRDAHVCSDTRLTDVAWQGCLDHANKNAAEARGEADKLRTALAVSHRQIAELTKPGTPIGWTTDEIANLIRERDEACTKYATLQSALTSPLDAGRVTIPLAAYDMLVGDRDRANARIAALEKELAATIPLYTLVEGKWVPSTPVPLADRVDYYTATVAAQRSDKSYDRA